MEKRVMMLIVGLIVVVGLPAMALCQEETAAAIEAAPADTGPAFVEEIHAAIDAIAPIPITQADIPLTISTPGSYYLTEDVTSAETAITVEVNDVTIDLAGFAVVGPDSGENYGIYMYGRSNVEIRNGTVRDFYYGIYEDHLGQGHRVINVRAVSNVTGGIILGGTGHLVKDCTVSENGDSATDLVCGISVGAGSTVSGNTVSNNGTSANNNVFSIHAHNGSTVTGNTVSNNGDSATGSNSLIVGILARHGSTVNGNTCYKNGYDAAGHVYGIHTYFGNGTTITGNTVHYNGRSAEGDVHGIRTGTGGTLIKNTVCDNGENGKGSYVYGIRAGYGITVTGNSCHSNGFSADGTVYGIYLHSHCLVDQNTAYNNGTNLYTGPGCEVGLNVAP